MLHLCFAFEYAQARVLMVALCSCNEVCHDGWCVSAQLFCFFSRVMDVESQVLSYYLKWSTDVRAWCVFHVIGLFLLYEALIFVKAIMR